ncbi:unnamed protein product [Didymodactylos carnosus]|uniref:Glycosyltransferase n=1 Tax=Didymodactylos carnosus TaxID=1234261 RepID=A0A813RL62_9BILA|nr:unnamed protein product [Didymodactylos carnosus]CAF3570016.1 unnamed protein product [Didymodactylos carnosus]
MKNDHISKNKMINMLNSLKLYFMNIERYPIYILHEKDLLKEYKNEIKTCFKYTLNIEFIEIEFNLTSKYNVSNNQFMPDIKRTYGYQAMCQFWSYDLFFSMNIVRNKYDYVMRLDDDSYLTNSSEYDLFEKFFELNLDYVYRLLYFDDNGLSYLKKNLKEFIPQNGTIIQNRRCINAMCTNLDDYHGMAIYNNFFILKLNFLYSNEIIELYLKQLIDKHYFYLYPIGDANIHAILLLLVKNTKTQYFIFPYNHNVHGAADMYATYVFFSNSLMWFEYMKRFRNNSCRNLIIATKRIVKIIDTRANIEKIFLT